MEKDLTNSEQIIFNLLVEGLPPKEIASRLNLSARTVSFHRSNIYKKLVVHNIQELLAKYNSAGRQYKEAASPVEPGAALSVNKKNKKLKYLIPLGILIFTVYNLLIWWFFIKPSDSLAKTGVPAEKPLTSLASEENPLEIDFLGQEQFNHNQCKLTVPVFFNPKITEGDIYIFYYSFTSSVDFKMFQLYLVDQEIEADNYFTPLTPYVEIVTNARANTVYSGKLQIFAAKTASSNVPNSNLLVIETYPYSIEQTTLTFTRFEFVKKNQRP
ncbi:MAG: helix-turn-helix transcriptional regulator [Treponema sp.]|jgi:DNA-binding CsgD family transcriptional regulator|nr:helix-turn-helix transcriptional regulator [Treponema sp.]